MSYDEHFTFTTVPYWVSLHPQASRGASSYVAPPQQQPQQQLQGSSGQVPYWVTAYPQASRSYVAPPQQQSQQQLQGSSGQVPYWVTAYPQASRSYVAPPQQQSQQQLQGSSGQVPYWVTAYPQASRSYVAPPQQQSQQQLQGSSGQVPYWVTAYPQASRSYVAPPQQQSQQQLQGSSGQVPYWVTAYPQASRSYVAPPQQQSQQQLQGSSGQVPYWVTAYPQASRSYVAPPQQQSQQQLQGSSGQVPYWVTAYPQASRSYVAPPQQQSQQQLQGSSGQVPYWVTAYPQASRSYVAPPQQQSQQQLQGSSGQVPYWVTAYPQASRSYVAPPQQQSQQQLQGSSGQVPYWVTAYPQASRSYVAPPQQQSQQQLQGSSGQVPYWVTAYPQASRSYVAPPQQQSQQQLQGSSGQVPYWVTAYPQASRSYVAPPQQQSQQQLQGSSGQVPYWVTAYPQASRSYVAPPQQQSQQQLQGSSGQVPYWVTAYPQASRSYVAPPQQQSQQQLQGSSGQVPYWVTAYPQASRSCVARRELRLNQSCMELPSHRVEVPHEERTEHIQASYSFLAPQPEPAVDALHPFPGQREVSQRGLHKVLVYDVPGSSLSYVFSYHKKTIKENTFVYRCVECKKINKHTSVKVIGDDFMTDPRMLDHRCIPVERAKDKANRMSYECLQTTRKNPEATLRPTQSYWLKVINQIENMEWEDIEKRMKVMHHFFKGGYESRRSAYSKAVKEGSAEVDMNNVPDPLRILPDGRTFLHYQQPTMHIYYSEDVIKRAIDNGLWALIGDGIHKLNPRSKRGSSVRMEEGQLYTIHGVCRGGFEVPLLFAITRRKREEEYVIVFEKMKQALESASESDPQSEFELTIVVDYELAAINAAKRVFPRCAIEGCCWHLSQAWVRRRNTLGILQFLKGRGKCGRVTRWWRTLKGLPFLPREMFHLVNALRRPPVPASHPAYLPCKKFLNYLQSTWLRGPFEKMWCKYMVHEQRTTNVAENYHMRLRQMIGKYHPALTELILVLRSVVAVAKATLSRMETFPNEMKKLRRKDRVRREKIEAAMSTFEASIQGGQNPSMAEIGRYCRKMSRYTSDKAV